MASIEDKARKILTEGRLIVERVDEGGLIVASCRGFSEGEIYKLGFDPRNSEWRCQCKANHDFRRRCAHIASLQLVTVKPKPKE